MTRIDRLRVNSSFTEKLKVNSINYRWLITQLKQCDIIYNHILGMRRSDTGIDSPEIVDGLSMQRAAP